MQEPDKKRCTICRQWKDLTKFHWKSKARGLRQSLCIECRGKGVTRYDTRDYERRRVYMLARSRAMTRLRKAFPELYQELLEEELRK